MKSASTPPRTVAAILLLASSNIMLAADVTKYADSGGKLSRDRYIDFIIDHYQIPYADLRPGPGKPITPASISGSPKVKGALRNLEVRHLSFPVNAKDVKKVMATSGQNIDTPLATWEERPAWKKVPPLTTPYLYREQEFSTKDGGTATRTKTGTVGDHLRFQNELKTDPELDLDDAIDTPRMWSLGPLRLRKEIGSLMDYNLEARNWEKWLGSEGLQEKDLKTIEGARVSYSDNRLNNVGGGWSTEGALIWAYHDLRNKKRGAPESDLDWSAFHSGMAVSWKIEDKESSTEKDINEIKFSAPVGYVMSKDDNQFFLSAEPYYQTDTHFDGGIGGSLASFEYANPDLWGYYSDIPGTNHRLSYRLRGRFIADWSEVTSTSRYFKRKLDDDWLRVGGKLSLDLGIFDPAGKENPLTFGVSYQFLDGITEDDGRYGDLWRFSANYWIYENMAISAEYQKGETPVANENIDLITFGLQLRY